MMTVMTMVVASHSVRGNNGSSENNEGNNCEQYIANLHVKVS